VSEVPQELAVGPADEAVGLLAVDHHAPMAVVLVRIVVRATSGVTAAPGEEPW
jgi:hypothetical protein